MNELEEIDLISQQGMAARGLSSETIGVSPAATPVTAPVTTPKFDPNAGKLDAYNQQLNAYLKEHFSERGWSERKERKTIEYFNRMFNWDWNANVGKRKSEFETLQLALQRLQERLRQLDRLVKELDARARKLEEQGRAFNGTDWILNPEKVKFSGFDGNMETWGNKLKAVFDENKGNKIWAEIAGDDAVITLDELKAWQQKKGLKQVDGKLGFNTLQAMGLGDQRFKYDWMAASNGKTTAGGTTAPAGNNGNAANGTTAATAGGTTANGTTAATAATAATAGNNGNPQNNSNSLFLTIDPSELTGGFDNRTAASVAFNLLIAQNDVLTDSAWGDNYIKIGGKWFPKVVFNDNSGGVHNDRSYIWDGTHFLPLEETVFGNNTWFGGRGTLLTVNGKVPKYTMSQLNAGEAYPGHEDSFWGTFVLKKGGIINKYKQGNKMNNEQELQRAFMAYLIEDAAAQGVLIQSEQDLQAYAQQLGKEGLEAKYQEFMQKMRGLEVEQNQGVKAALGAKLNYIRKIKGMCPDGQETYFFKEGGSVKSGCKPCMAKAQKGQELKKKGNAVDQFKNRHINPNDTVWADGDKNKARTLTDDRNKPLVKGMKPYSAAEYQRDLAKGRKGDKSAARRVEKQDEKTMYACGGKSKKKKN